MRKVQKDDVIRVHYTGKLEDGTEFDSSKGKNPIEFKVGQGSLIPGFENGVIGMEQGETKTVSIPPDEAYGKRQDELVAQINKTEFPSDITPKEGMQLQLKSKDGQTIPVMIVNINDDIVTLDANPPLAGKTLIFDLEMVEFV